MTITFVDHKTKEHRKIQFEELTKKSKGHTKAWVDKINQCVDTLKEDVRMI